jgi:hypothetical protein
VLFLEFSFGLAMLLPAPVNAVLGLVLRITGVVLLWRAPWWTARQKALGTVVIHLIPITLTVMWRYVLPDTPPWTSTTAWLLVNALLVLLYLSGSAWLWRTRTTP